jgi:tRNA pseudouridine13 synthase
VKLKQSPDDFHVEELTAIVPTEGPFALYRLTKRDYTTPDALAILRTRWKIAPNRVSAGGLKDRHAETTQHVTILHGPQRKLTHDALTLQYLGQVSAPFTSKDIAANRFRIVLRDTDELALTRAELIGINGVPNYFDDQRFGSASADGEFIARLMVLGKYEDALKLALTMPYEFDKAPQKTTKATLLRLWGEWTKCVLPSGPTQRIAQFLANRTDDYRGAVHFLHPELQGLSLAAYQSFIWNRMLAALIRRTVPSPAVLRLKLGDCPTASRLTVEQRDQLMATSLPLPSARLPWDATAPWAGLVEEALSGQGFALPQMKLPGLRKPFFSKGDRAAWVVPQSFSAVAQPNDRTLTLAFDLPRGSYATIIVKHIQVNVA